MTSKCLGHDIAQCKAKKAVNLMQHYQHVYNQYSKRGAPYVLPFQNGRLSKKVNIFGNFDENVNFINVVFNYEKSWFFKVHYYFLIHNSVFENSSCMLENSYFLNVVHTSLQS